MSRERKIEIDNKDLFDELQLIVQTLRQHCQDKKTIKAAMPTLRLKTGLPEERIIHLIKKYFKE